MSLLLAVLLAWLVILPLGFMVVAAVYPRYLRWRVHGPGSVRNLRHSGGIGLGAGSEQRGSTRASRP